MIIGFSKHINNGGGKRILDINTSFPERGKRSRTIGGGQNAKSKDPSLNLTCVYCLFFLPSNDYTIL